MYCFYVPGARKCLRFCCVAHLYFRNLSEPAFGNDEPKNSTVTPLLKTKIILFKYVLNPEVCDAREV